MASVSQTTIGGSTLPLVIISKEDLSKNDEYNDYNPFEHRQVKHPTTDWDTFIHVLKGSLGSGILAMPLAFRNAGLWFGLISTFIICIICTYCVHILVKCSTILCKRNKIPSLRFAGVAEVAFQSGPEAIRKWSGLAKFMINSAIVVDLLGSCCVYNVFVAASLKQLIEHYCDVNYNIRIYIVVLLVPLILMNLVRSLKYLMPFSFIANCLIAIGVGVTLYYILNDLPSVTERKSIADVKQWPMFFGTVIFSLECIAVVMSLENNMKTPEHFIGCPSVLNFGMTFVVCLYTIIGFMGYLKYGEETEASITLNLPIEDILAQSVKIIIAIAIFFTYALQFYAPMEVIWKSSENYFDEKFKNKAEYCIRITLVVLTVLIAVAIPNLGPFITLIGALCLSTLGLMFPSIIETVTYWNDPGLGKYNWILWKNVFLIGFGIVGLLTGTYVSVQEIIENYA